MQQYIKIVRQGKVIIRFKYPEESKMAMEYANTLNSNHYAADVNVPVGVTVIFPLPIDFGKKMIGVSGVC